MYRLTKEGLDYLQTGLPEKRLLQLLKDGKLSISEVRKAKNSSIALGWAKKNGWVKIEAGYVTILPAGLQVIGRKTKLEEAFEDVHRTGKADKGMARILLGRNLIEEAKERKAIKIKEIIRLTPEILASGAWRGKKFRKYNIDAPAPDLFLGKKQPYLQFLDKIRLRLVELGFKEMTGPLIETEFYNFDAIFQPQNHPARDWTDTYRLKYPKYGRLPDKRIVERVKAAHEHGWKTGSTGWGYKWDPKKAMQLMPRAHGTALSARQIASGIEIPGMYFSMARCYRPDILDSTHLIEFNQVEGFVADPSLTFRNLLGILKKFAEEVAGAKEIRFFPDYYPFTEPSVQISAKHPDLGWVEFGGAGLFRPELTEPLGVKEPVIAWGIGVDRLAMFKLGIRDIRQLFSSDVDWLRGSEVVR